MIPKIAIKVVGVGGAGGNAIDRMVQCKVAGVELLAVNTDAQDLKKIQAHKKIQIGRESTRGLGAGMNPEVGKKAALESKEELLRALEGADLVFVAAGLGGGTGGGAVPVIAEIAKGQGSLVIAVVTTPFSFEGAWRLRLAHASLGELKGKVDTLLSIPNDQILKITGPDTTVSAAFWKADEVLREAVQGISDLIALPGIVNVDFADLRGLMKNAGQAVFGVGYGKGDKRMDNALNSAFHSPLLTSSLKGAKGVLFNIAGSQDLSLEEVQGVAQKIKQEVSPNARIIFGAAYDKSLKQGEVKLTVIATGFDQE
ncbi:MAG: cell division protein FtsZ [Candidatus Wildermuthbacteria bacterium]|nr:cell division protein FtsZ [Candidatus Wildermuthbacteria bacterium]